MAQVNIRPNDAATYVGGETVAFGTPPESMTRCTPISGSVEITTNQTQLENESESVYLHDRKARVHGFREGEVKLGYYFKTPTAQLNAAATPATPPLGLLLFAALSGEVSAAGSTVQDTSTTSAVLVAAGHGTRFAVGSIAYFPVGGTLEPAMVTAVSTDTRSR
jgi:hypothetical protein